MGYWLPWSSVSFVIFFLIFFSNFCRINAYKKIKRKKERSSNFNISLFLSLSQLYAPIALFGSYSLDLLIIDFAENAGGRGGKGGWYLFVEPIFHWQRTVVKKIYIYFHKKKKRKEKPWQLSTQLINSSTSLSLKLLCMNMNSN